MSGGALAGRTMDSADVIRVLVADPDQGLQAAYREHLSEDIELSTALSGLECCARLRERIPSVLVLEPDLPWGGGDGVLAAMRDDVALAAIPVMILTACRDVQILRSVSTFPISDYHVKPLAPSQLLTRIRALLNRRRLRRAAARERRVRDPDHRQGAEPWGSFLRQPGHG
jgi:DNA-binding response OmpR family regulator